ncbi:hypothetical protein [Catenovulum sediminis]|uniref:Uncharacterized protein n=1 Tax=Catenovulum sediminis TaxID=1740262 RepID=A0ABV1RI17_9ALTE|nr:hypothetical protein [Catenovulum sediminis]
MSVTSKDIVRTAFIIFALVLCYQIVFVSASQIDWFAAPIASLVYALLAFAVQRSSRSQSNNSMRQME